MAASSTTVTASGSISPKVFWPLVVAVVLTFVGSFLAAVTPEMLSALGPFAVPMAISLTAVANVVAGYLKSDELRDIGVQATAAVLPDQVHPTYVPPVYDEPVDPAPPGSTAVSETLEESPEGSAAARMRAELNADGRGV